MGNIVAFFAMPSIAMVVVISLQLVGRKMPILRARIKPHTIIKVSKSLIEKYSLQTKLKLLIGFYQLVSRLDDVYELALPRSVRSLNSLIKLTISFGLEGLSFGCVLPPGYLWRLVFWLCMPVVIVAVVIGFEVILWRKSCLRVRSSAAARSQLIGSIVPTVLRLAFLFYPIATNVAFDAFSCVTFDDDSSWLMTDVSVRCGSSAHHRVTAIAVFGIAVYSIGLWVVNAMLLRSVRRAVVSGKPTPLSKATSFLHQDYDRKLYAWELMETARRFLLVGLFGVRPYARGTMMQLMLATILTFTYVVIQLVAMPYQAFSDNFLALACSVFLSFFLLGANYYKYAALTSTSEVALAIGTEQVDDFKLDVPALTVVLLSCLLGSLVACALILIIQFIAEARRRRREARAAQARRLCVVASGEEVILGAPVIPASAPYTFEPTYNMGNVSGRFHIFLSHVWGTGQDQMRIVKQRLREMLPDVVPFLDVDDLKEGKGAEYVDASAVSLILCSGGYFQSPNCMREILRGVVTCKPIVALLEPEATHGGLTLKQIREALDTADKPCEKRGKKHDTWYHMCDLHSEVVSWGYEMPTGAQLYDALFAREPIEWNRIGAFQDVTLRLIASTLLPEGYGATFVQGELISQELPPLQAPKLGNAHHVYCSAQNPGAIELMAEVATRRGLAFKSGQGVGSLTRKASTTSTLVPKRKGSSKTAAALQVNVLHATDDFECVDKCEHMLLYLNGQTWTRGEDSTALADEVIKAMDKGVHILLTHEMPGVGGQETRFGCEFGNFFVCADGTTPQELLQLGIYDQIATPLRGGAWREASMVMVAAGLIGDDSGEKQVSSALPVRYRDRTRPLSPPQFLLRTLSRRGRRKKSILPASPGAKELVSLSNEDLAETSEIGLGYERRSMLVRPFSRRGKRRSKARSTDSKQDIFLVSHEAPAEEAVTPAEWLPPPPPAGTSSNSSDGEQRLHDALMPGDHVKRLTLFTYLKRRSRRVEQAPPADDVPAADREEDGEEDVPWPNWAVPPGWNGITPEPSMVAMEQHVPLVVASGASCESAPSLDHPSPSVHEAPQLPAPRRGVSPQSNPSARPPPPLPPHVEQASQISGCLPPTRWAPNRSKLPPLSASSHHRPPPSLPPDGGAAGQAASAWEPGSWSRRAQQHQQVLDYAHQAHTMYHTQRPQSPSHPLGLSPGLGVPPSLMLDLAVPPGLSPVPVPSAHQPHLPLTPLASHMTPPAPIPVPGSQSARHHRPPPTPPPSGVALQGAIDSVWEPGTWSRRGTSEWSRHVQHQQVHDPEYQAHTTFQPQRSQSPCLPPALPPGLPLGLGVAPSMSPGLAASVTVGGHTNNSSYHRMRPGPPPQQSQFAPGPREAGPRVI